MGRVLELQSRAPKTSTRPPTDWSSDEGREMLGQAFRRAGVPDLYARATWGAVVHAKRTLGRYAKDIRSHVAAGRGLVISGPVGTGKSSAAGLIAGVAVRNDITVLWQHVPAVVGELITPEGKHELRRAMTAELLIWDDFTLGGLTDWQIATLDRVVERRYSSMRPMIVTANIPRKVMLEAPEIRRMVDRWSDRCEFVSMSGESLRATWKG